MEKGNNKKNFKENVKDVINDVDDSTKKFTKEEIKNGKGMGVLSYIIPLIPFLCEKKNKYAMYHAKQGMNLFIVSIAYSIVYSILTSVIKVEGSCGKFGDYFGVTCKVTPLWVTLPLTLISLCICALCIIGIVNVCQGKAKELPIVNKVKIFK